MEEFLQNNWFWIVVLALFVGMHSLGMGCGGHRHGGYQRKKREKNEKRPVIISTDGQRQNQ